jgi:hypothetical protein
MRPFTPLAAAAALALSACGNNDQADNTQNVDENLAAENIVSNDVTAIDAVTGDQANMAADVEISNDLDANLEAGLNGASAAKPAHSKSGPKSSANPSEPAADTSAGNSL